MKFLLVIISPFVALLTYFVATNYISGTGKARYIKETTGIDLPWYQAASITVSVSDSRVRADVRSEPGYHPSDAEHP